MEEFLPVLEKYKGRGLPDDGWLPDPPAGALDGPRPLGGLTRASSASWSVGFSWLCRSASTRRR